MNLVSPTEAQSVDWIKGSLASQGQRPLTWYKVNPSENWKEMQLN